jgi:hypothetical protein
MSVENWLPKIRAWAGKPLFRAIVGGLVLALSLAYMAYTLIRNWNELATYDWQVHYGQIALSFACYSASLMSVVWGWSKITGRLTRVTRFRKHFKYYVYTNLTRRLPAPLLYLLGRMYLYEREGVSKSLMAVTSLLEWVLLVLSSMIVYLLSVPFAPLPAFWRSPWISLGGLAVGILLVHPRVIRALLRFLGQKEPPIHFGYGEVLAWLGIYSMVWIGGGTVLYAIINSLYPLPLARLPAVIGIWALSGLATSLAFILSAGFGLKELTLTILLEPLMPSSLAVIVALLVRVCITLFEMLWGLVALKL